MKSVKKLVCAIFVLVLFLCLSPECFAAAGTYEVTCTHCYGRGTVSTTVQEYGTCSNCDGDRYISSPGSSKMCFSCGSRNWVHVSTPYNVYDVCNDCGSSRIYGGYICGACDGVGRKYNTVQRNETCSYCRGSGTVSTNCYNHTYGAWTKTDAASHSHTCSRCEYVETVNHTWNKGTVTRAATCKEKGEKLYTCTGCGATKTESIAKKSTHSYGAWVKVDDSTHKHTCSVCSKKETANHKWDSGTITEMPTHSKEGIRTFTCTTCNATKTASIPKLVSTTPAEQPSGSPGSTDFAGQQAGSQNNANPPQTGVLVMDQGILLLAFASVAVVIMISLTAILVLRSRKNAAE